MKNLIVFIFILISISAVSQTKNWSIEAYKEFILSGDSLRATTQVDANDTTFATKQYVLNTAGTGNGWDSLTWNKTTGDVVWWYSGARIDSMNIDDRYVLLSDSTSQYLTADSIATLVSSSGAQSVYKITIPIAGTLSGSVALMVEGTDYPTGWTIAASGGDLEINHGLSRYAANVNVFYNTTGTSYRQLVNFQNAYSGVLNEDVNNVNIESISTFYTAYKLKLFIILE